MKSSSSSPLSSLARSSRSRASATVWERRKGGGRVPVCSRQARMPILSASDGRSGVGCEWDRCFSAAWCSLGPSISKFRCPAVATKQWRRRSEGIRSSRVLPRLGGALLRCRQRARRGGVRLRRLLYRSMCRPLFRRCGGARDAFRHRCRDGCGSCGRMASGSASTSSRR